MSENRLNRYELELMNVLWTIGKGTVQDVCDNLTRELAYTTVMTTLNLLATARFGPERLPADWLWMGDPVKPWSQRPARFGYEAIRIPLFLAWSRQSSHPALLALAAHFKPAGFPAWVDLATPEVAPYAAPAGFQSVAALVRAQAFGTPPSFHPIDDDYYSSSLSLLARLAWQDVRGR